MCSQRTHDFHASDGRHTYAERQPGETANDRNDRAIRKAVAWYADHLKDTKIDVVLITNDADNRKQALADGLNAYTSKLPLVLVYCWHLVSGGNLSRSSSFTMFDGVCLS